MFSVCVLSRQVSLPSSKPGRARVGGKKMPQICFSLFQLWPEDQAEESRLPPCHLCLQRPAAPAAADHQQGDRQERTSGKDQLNRLRPPPPPRPAGRRSKRAGGGRAGTGQRSRWATLQGQEVMRGGLKRPREIPVARKRCRRGGNQGTNLSSPAWTEARFHFSIHKIAAEVTCL